MYSQAELEKPKMYNLISIFKKTKLLCIFPNLIEDLALLPLDEIY